MTKRNYKGPAVRTVPARIATLKPAVRGPKHDARRDRGRRATERHLRYLRWHPLCCVCEHLGIAGASAECDHIVPLHAGGEDVWPNLQAMCHAHHVEKTNRDARGEYQLMRYPQRPESDLTIA